MISVNKPEEISEIRYQLQRNFIAHTEADIKMIFKQLQDYDLRMVDIQFQVDSVDTVLDVVDIIHNN